MVIMRPGGTQNQGMSSMIEMFCASLSMLPQLGIGTCTPKPKKLSPASVRMALAMPKLAATVMGATTLGRMWRMIIHFCSTPTAWAAMT